MPEKLKTVWETFFVTGWWIAILVFSCAFSVLAYLHGRFWARLLRRARHPLSLFCTGLVSVLALEEFFAWPVVAYRLSSDLLLGITAAVVLVPPIVSFFLKPAEKKFGRPSVPLLVFTGILVLFVVLSCTFEYRFSGDDSFYVSSIAQFAKAERINLFDASMGDPTASTVPMYDFQVWESLLSVICRVTGLKATVLSRTLLVAPLIFISCCAYFHLGRTLLKDDNKALFFTAAVTVFHLGCRYVNYSEGSFLLGRIWQGKSVDLTVVLPLLAAETVDLFSSDKKRIPVMIWLAVLAGAALNPTSLYLNGFELLFLGLAMAVVTHRYRRLTRLIPAVLITGFFTLLIYLRTSRNAAGIIVGSSTVDPGFWLSALKNVFGNVLPYAGLYLASLVYILFRGDREAKAFFLVSALFMLVCLWNPLTGRFVAEKITKEPTYWRVFWLVPLGAGIAWAASDLAFRAPKKFVLPAAAALLAVVVLAGNWFMEDYTPARNPEKISPSVLNVTRNFDGDTAGSPVLAVSSVSMTLRQENPDVWLLVSRTNYTEDVYTSFGRTEEGQDRRILYDFVNGTLEDCSAVPALLDRYGVETVVLRNDSKKSVAVLKEGGWTLKEKYGAIRRYERAPDPAP